MGNFLVRYGSRVVIYDCRAGIRLATGMNCYHACAVYFRGFVINSGQSYKHFTIVNYDSRVIPDRKIPHIMTLQS